MNDLFQERRNLFLAFAGLILALLIVLFFVVLQPLLSDKKAAQAKALELDKQVNELEMKVKRAKNMPTVDNTFGYEKQIPLAPETEDLLRSFSEISTASKSRIDRIEFGYDGTIPEPPKTDEEKQEKEKEKEQDNPDADKDADENENDQGKQDAADTDENKAENAESANTAARETELAAPDDLHVLAIRMEVDSPDYEHFDILMKELEKMERVTVVNTLNFKAPNEQEFALEPIADESVTCTVEMMAFYYTGEVKKPGEDVK